MESDYAEENLSTKQPTPRQKARLQSADGYKKWPRRSKAPSRKGPQAINSSTLLNFRLPKESRLRRRAEFLRVYENGRRFEGRFMTVFILPNKLEKQRVG